MGLLVFGEYSAISMRLGTWLAAGKLTLLSRSSTTSRTTDSERVSWAGVLFHGERWKRSTRVFNRRYASAHRIFGSAMTEALATHIRQSLKTQLKMRTPFKWLP
jgi:hypothetical protein